MLAGSNPSDIVALKSRQLITIHHIKTSFIKEGLHVCIFYIIVTIIHTGYSLIFAYHLPKDLLFFFTCNKLNFILGNWVNKMLNNCSQSTENERRIYKESMRQTLWQVITEVRQQVVLINKIYLSFFSLVLRSAHASACSIM